MADAKLALTANQQFVLDWLSKEDLSAYGECRGRDLDVLIERRLVALARDPPTDWTAVFLTEDGWLLVTRAP